MLINKIRSGLSVALFVGGVLGGVAIGLGSLRGSVPVAQPGANERVTRPDGLGAEKPTPDEKARQGRVASEPITARRPDDVLNGESERTVALGLIWLARQQKEDGGWEFDAGDKNDRIAATGLALLPFFGAGESHLKGVKHAKVVKAGLEWLVKNQISEGADTGKFKTAATTDSHAIATLTLCEAYALTKDKELLAPAQRAVNSLQKMQTENGGWPAVAGDAGVTSLVGWPLQALKAAQLGKDVTVDPDVLKKAVGFLNLTGGGTRKAMYGHKGNVGAAPGTALTAVGLLSRYYIDGWGPDNAGMAEGVTGLMKRAPVKSTASPDMYFYYYATQVAHLFDGDEWKTWNEGPKGADGVRKGGLRDLIIRLQIKEDGVDNQGSFDPDEAWIGKHYGRLGTTAMSVLTLEVYYRHLTLYKRGSGGDGALVDPAK